MIDYNYGVKLDAPTEEDINKFYDWRNDERVWKWCRQNGPLTKHEHQAYWNSVPFDKTVRFFSVIYNSKLVGCCGFTSIDYLNRRAEFSCYIGPEFQDQGYGSGALKTLFSYGFKFLNLYTIWGESFAGNPAIKIFEKIGMKFEGERRSFYFRDSDYLNAFLYSILRPEWDQLKSDW